ncbi:MAG TPA: tRNA uridine(34) 5-carboxymethylaminomethyl modification radical SAM/GNAT enzyme Elp3 [Candidatus Thermoplasmatota archaeon]|nr:tRNA uridine(34) 5-carboxymethylaminomethyl modification radical SAM/GNAT enzyme Elp3 [Candidatus Thermoplasmatota archaeon]
MAYMKLPDPVVRAAFARLAALASPTAADVQRLKVELAEAYKLDAVPSNADLLSAATGEERARFESLLRTKPTRSLSGVVIVTIQSSPEACPHGQCTFCPGGPEWGTAMSYTGKEPAARRALRHAFDPYAQTASRLEDLHATGHPVDKVDFIVQGGTFTARDPAYQTAFLKAAFDAMNAWGGHRPDRAATLEEAMRANEDAHARMIGLTIETKPDWAQREHLDLALDYGTTRIELGLQTTDERALAATNRGHTLAESIEAVALVKDAGLKLCAHVMPGLPGSSYESDLETFRRMFQDPDFRPDMLKIYPTLVIPGTPLALLHARGRFEPVDEAYCAKLLAEAKRRFVEPWCRIQRIDRDIPSTEIAAGVKKLNLRQLVLAELARDGSRCRCIRCREAGRRPRSDGEVALVERRYAASGGVEHFASIEDVEADAILGFVRVREPGPRVWRPEAEGAAFLRELRVYGSEVPIGAAPGDSPALQHRGLGARLLERAEAIARGAGYRRLLVTSGVGVRAYYAKHGYERAGAYMGKTL